MRNREGAFDIYNDTEVELVGYTTCDSCPGGNIEYAREEMVKNGGEVIHLATVQYLCFSAPPKCYDMSVPSLHKKEGDHLPC